MVTVNVYSTSTCPFCVLAKDFLKSNKIPFNDINVGEDTDAAMHMIEISGQRGVPVIEIGKRVIIGFDKDAISRELKIKK